jgi:DNA polymerase-3 subunit delta'
VVLIEDADRLTEKASNALLKAVEEPSPRTVFLLCTPSTHPDDVSVTIRSRCRVVTLRTPSAESIADMLVRLDGVDPRSAQWAAAASQGHVGRARRLARDPEARLRREAVLAVPRRLTGIGACFDAASALITATESEASANVSDVDIKEKAELEMALGAGGTGRGAAGAFRGSAGAMKELERKQKSRATRAKRDALDRALVDLAGFYRDVLAVRLGAAVPAVHVDTVADAAAAAQKWTPEATLRRLEAVLACRDAIEANVKPQIAVESMMVTLWRG